MNVFLKTTLITKIKSYTVSILDSFYCRNLYCAIFSVISILFSNIFPTVKRKNKIRNHIYDYILHTLCMIYKFSVNNDFSLTNHNLKGWRKAREGLMRCSVCVVDWQIAKHTDGTKNYLIEILSYSLENTNR